MALETLNDFVEIDGFSINHCPECDISQDDHVVINHRTNTITFRVQKGPIKEVGSNGCQVDTIIATAKVIIEELNKNYPCRENAVVITKLDEALLWLMKRKLDRERRGVEGLNKE